MRAALPPAPTGEVGGFTFILRYTSMGTARIVNWGDKGGVPTGEVVVGDLGEVIIPLGAVVMKEERKYTVELLIKG